MTEAQRNVFILNCIHDLFIFWIPNLWICPLKITWIFLAKRSHCGKKRQADFLINLFLPTKINREQSVLEWAGQSIQSSSSRIHPHPQLISSRNPPVLNSFSGLGILTQSLTLQSQPQKLLAGTPVRLISQTHNEIKIIMLFSLKFYTVLYSMEKLHHTSLEQL